MAGGFLTKWTAPAFFYLTVVPLLWWRGRLKLLLGRSHLASLSVAVGICLAWLATAATTVGWEVLFETVRREALQRLSPQHHYRCYPWSEVLSFPLVFLAANLPWSAFALATLHPRFAEPWDDRGRRVLQTLHCWLWINLLFWSVVPGHRPRHCLPLQPAIAGLAALVCLACLDGRLRAYRPRTILVGLLGLFLAIKLVHVQFRIPARDQGRHLRQSGDLLASLVPAGQTLYLRQLKDEGLLFYFGRPTRRLADPNQLPSRPFYCLLTAEEWQHWGGDKVLALSDGQGAPLVLARAP